MLFSMGRSSARMSLRSNESVKMSNSVSILLVLVVDTEIDSM